MIKLFLALMLADFHIIVNGSIKSLPCYTKYRNANLINRAPYRTEVGALDYTLCLDRCQEQNRVVLTCYGFTHQSYGNYPCNFFGDPGSTASKLMVTFLVDYFETKSVCYPPTTTMSSTTISGASASPPLGSAATCQAGEKQIIIASINQKTGKTPNVTITVKSDFECVMKCLSNQGNGSTPIACVAVEVMSPDQCKMFTEKTDPAALVDDTATDYYEKSCLPANLIAKCPEPVGPFYRQKGSFLAGVVTRIETAPSTEACLLRCIELGLECASANYYIQTGNCLIKKLRRADRPDLFTTAPQSTVYLENGCYAALKANVPNTTPLPGGVFGPPGSLGGGLGGGAAAFAPPASRAANVAALSENSGIRSILRQPVERIPLNMQPGELLTQPSTSMVAPPTGRSRPSEASTSFSRRQRPRKVQPPHPIAPSPSVTEASRSSRDWSEWSPCLVNPDASGDAAPSDKLFQYRQRECEEFGMCYNFKSCPFDPSKMLKPEPPAFHRQ